MNARPLPDAAAVAALRHARPLSPAQLPIWHAEVLHRGTPRWTQFSVTTLTGNVDPARLGSALRTTVAYYPALRTCLLRHKHKVLQTFHDAAGFGFGLRDVSMLPAAVRDQAVAELLSEGERYRFELYGHWLFRADIVACAPDRTLLLLFMHHIATDGMSLPSVLQRVSLAYRGQMPAAQADDLYEPWLDRQTGGDFAAALQPARDFYRHALAGATFRHEKLYDREAATGAHEPPDLPQCTRLLEPATTCGLLRLAERTGSTLFIVCLAAYGLALSRVTGAQDMVIAVFVSGRAGLSGLVAMAVNTLLVRLRMEADMTPPALIQCVKEAWRPARRLEAVPFHALRQPALSEVATCRDAGDGGTAASAPSPPGPVEGEAQCAMNFLDMRSMTLDLPEVMSHTTYPQSAFPLNDALLLVFREHDDRMRLRLFNGSGTGRLSAGRLAVVCATVADVLLGWSEAATVIPNGAGTGRQK